MFCTYCLKKIVILGRTFTKIMTCHNKPETLTVDIRYNTSLFFMNDACSNREDEVNLSAIGP